MANEGFQRASGKSKMAYLGIDTHRPFDLQKPGRAPYMLNVSPDIKQGSLAARGGLTPVTSSVGAPVHSLVRVNSELPGSPNPFLRYVGAGLNLYSGAGPGLGFQDSGFSGNPLSLVPFRPPQSPEPWLYVFDSLKQQKYRNTGAKANIGILPPTTEPATTLDFPLNFSLLDASSAAGWSGSGICASPTYEERVNYPAVFDGQLFWVFYDQGITGWASLALGTGTEGIVAGMRLKVGNEWTTIQQTFPPITNTFVKAIIFDNGATVGPGLCTVVPVAPVQGVAKDMMVLIGNFWVKVLSVTSGPDGAYSFRTYYPPAAVGAGDQIFSTLTARCYLTQTHVPFESLLATSLKSTCTVTGGSGSGTISQSGLSIDLTRIGDFPITTEDYMHLSVMCDNPNNLQEIHVMVDVDESHNDFNHNSFYYVLRQADFTPVVAGTATTLQARLTSLSNSIAEQENNAQVTNSAFGYPNPVPADFSIPTADQLPIGAGQWLEGMWKIGDMSRVGTDAAVALNNVKAIGIFVIATGPLNIQFGGWYVMGGFGPDTNWNSFGNQGLPILYRYRYRSSLTGAISDPGPATRNGELPKRTGVIVTVQASPDPQVDLIDIERLGGTFDTWHRVLAVPNGNQFYSDWVRETVAMAGEPLERLQYMPWPVTDKPRYGTCSIVGTRVTWLSGDPFNLNWIRGIEFIVNNQTYTLHAPPDSTTTLSLEQNVGYYPNLSFIIPEATIIGYPLPYACEGPDGRIFATGDPYNPGLLYFTNNYSPDTASDRGYIEVSSPSDPLGPPVYYEGEIYVFTATAGYRVVATPGQVNPYAKVKLSGVTGLSAPWAISAGSVLAYLTTDGIAVMGGQGGSVNITKDDLFILFPFESRPGLSWAVNGYILYPPNLSQMARLRLSQANGYLYFTYLDIAGQPMTLAYNMETKGWVPYQYGGGSTLLYQEEGIENPPTLVGLNDGTISQISNAVTDNGVPFTCVIVTPSDDQNETRARKQYGDMDLDMQTVAGCGVRVHYDNLVLPGSNYGMALGDRGPRLFDLGLDASSLHRNIALQIAWLSDTGTVLYEWQPSFLLKPEDTIDRPTDWLDAGTMSMKFVHGLRITADTYGVSRTVQIQYDGGIIGPTLTVAHNGEVTLPYSFPPFKAHLMRLVPTDPNLWRLMQVEWEVDLEPESTGYWVTQPTTWGMSGFLHCRDMYFAYACMTGGQIIQFVIDGTLYRAMDIFPLPATGGVEVKKYIVLPPFKGKVWQIYASGPPMQVYFNDCELRIKPWGAASYNNLKPIGAPTVTSGGAKI